jgi:cobalt-zinc-cadmium efflux system outer membrane protein
MLNKTLFVPAVLAGMLITPVWAKQTSSQINLDQNAPADIRTLVSDILPTHPRLLAARDELHTAVTRLQAADRPLYNPELEIDTENTDINTSTLQLSQTIDSGGQRNARTRVATAELESARAAYELAELKLLKDLLITLANEQSGRKIAELAKEGLGLMREFADIAQQRYQAGDLTLVERDLAQLAYNEALMTHAQALSDAAAARENLIALYQRPPLSTPNLPELLPSPELPANVDAFLNDLPVMRKSEHKLIATSENVDLRQSERSWEPTIAVRGGREDEESLVGVTLSLPLKIRNNQKAEVQTARQELARSEQALRQQKRDTKARLLSSTERYRLLQTAFNEWLKTGRGHVTRQLKLIKRLWRSGDMSTTEYLVQLKQALETQASGIELRNKMWRSSFEWMNDTASIDNWLQLSNTGSQK